MAPPSVPLRVTRGEEVARRVSGGHRQRFSKRVALASPSAADALAAVRGPDGLGTAFGGSHRGTGPRCAWSEPCCLPRNSGPSVARGLNGAAWCSRTVALGTRPPCGVCSRPADHALSKRSAVSTATVAWPVGATLSLDARSSDSDGAAFLGRRQPCLRRGAGKSSLCPAVLFPRDASLARLGAASGIGGERQPDQECRNGDDAAAVTSRFGLRSRSGSRYCANAGAWASCSPRRACAYVEPGVGRTARRFCVSIAGSQVGGRMAAVFESQMTRLAGLARSD